MCSAMKDGSKTFQFGIPPPPFWKDISHQKAATTPRENQRQKDSQQETTLTSEGAQTPESSWRKQPKFGACGVGGWRGLKTNVK